MIYLGKNAVGISDTVQVVSEDIVNRVNAIGIKETISTPTNILTITDGADNIPIDNMIIAVEPVQDLHGYDNPWPAGGGKNLIPYPYNDGDTKTVSGITFITNLDGSVKFQGTAIGVAYYNLYGSSSAPIPSWVKPDTTYYLNPAVSSGKYFIQFILYGSTSFTQTGGRSFTTPSDFSSYTACAIVIGIYNGAVVDDTVYPMLEYGSTASDWSPYSNICPISGWTGAKVTRTGKNLCSSAVGRYTWANGVRYINELAYCATVDKIQIAGGQTYTVSLNNTGVTSTIYVAWYQDGAYLRQDSDSVAPYIFTAPDNATECTITIRNGSNYTGDPTVSNLQIEPGTTATAYEPYHGEAYSIEFPSEARTVYGGNLTLHQNGSGELVVDRAYHAVNENDTVMLFMTGTNGNRVGIVLLDSVLSETAEKRVDIICNKAVATTDVLMADRLRIGICCMYSGTGETYSKALISVPTSVTSAADAKAYLVSEGYTFVYKLATKITISLSAQQITTLLGINNIWADCGNISITYSADTKLYIDGQQTEDDMTANANIPNGNYFQIGNTLYKATAAIAQGETIIPGTNCTRTTFAEALNLLAAQ